MADFIRLYKKNGNEKVLIHPETSASHVLINDAAGTASDVDTEIVALRTLISQTASNGVKYMGTLSQASDLPAADYKAGHQYAVAVAGTYAGKVCEVGDLVQAKVDYAAATASNDDWMVIQANIVGAVTGPASSVAQHVAIFSDTSGKIVADSGFTIAKSVPADAQFTDTTYSEATTSVAGLMSANDKAKLDGIESGADVTDATNVAAAGAFMKSGDTADSISDGTTKVVMTAAERTKLTGIATGAEVNQNAVGGIKVGANTIEAAAKQDTVEFEAGSGITMTADTTNKKVTVAETYIDVCSVSSLNSVPANLRDGGLIILAAE